MSTKQIQEAAELIYQELRLDTLPVALKIHEETAQEPEKTRRPARDLGKRITICQAVGMARTYGWTLGLEARDIACVPALICFGHSSLEQPRQVLAEFFSQVGWSRDLQTASREMENINCLPRGRAGMILLAPLKKALFHPDVVVVYANPAQIMRLVHAWTFTSGKPVQSEVSGKVECNKYLLGPFLHQAPEVVIPGNGDRIMSRTQDQEMIFAFPGSALADISQGLESAGRKMGARYPVPFYQNFEPEFPPVFRELAQKAGLEMD
ncbi:MAG: DUF169 domain-containing protein [Desulfohalobiaceae bacterium]